VWIYNFEPGPQKGELHVWGLDNGQYDVRFGHDANDDEAIDSLFWQKKLRLARNVAIPLKLPSRQLVVLEAKQVQRGPSIFAFPDLAVTSTDAAFDRNSRKLTFVVHNVGNRSAENVEVAVYIDGRQVAARRIPKIEAPLDLKPRTVAFTQAAPKGVLDVLVKVDPHDAITELWEGNNVAQIQLPR